MNLQEVDLVRTTCPNGTIIEIEGVGKMGVGPMPGQISLLQGIAHVLCIFSGETIIADTSFLERIQLLELELSKKRKFVRVRIAND